MKQVLNESQIERIADTVNKSNIESAEMKTDLIDHLCCIIEDEMSKGKNFDVAYRTTLQLVSPDGLDEIQNETVYLFTSKNRKRLDRTMYVSGFTAFAGTLITAAMKIFHLPFAQLALLATAFVAMFVLFPVCMFRQTSDKKPGYNLNATIVALLVVAYAVFFISDWPGAHIILLLIVFCVYCGLFPLFFLKIFKKSKLK